MRVAAQYRSNPPRRFLDLLTVRLLRRLARKATEVHLRRYGFVVIKKARARADFLGLGDAPRPRPRHPKKVGPGQTHQPRPALSGRQINPRRRLLGGCVAPYSDLLIITDSSVGGLICFNDRVAALASASTRRRYRVGHVRPPTRSSLDLRAELAQLEQNPIILYRPDNRRI